MTDRYRIDKAEVLRYLGIGTAGVITDEQRNDYEALSEKLDCVIKLCKKTAMPRFITGSYEIEKSGEDYVMLRDCDVVLRGKDIAEHLCGAKEVVFMALTLGSDVERELLRLQVNSLADAVIYDAAASAYIESVADACEAELRMNLSKRGLRLNTRYSPGYGDFCMEAQRDIVRLLSCDRKLGLYVTDGMMLVPVKSITAVAGAFSYE